jgi:2-polyprenyl-3-methyl-5-hydroxy-6-metoxy-1,4-benzoquinol methylase
LSHKDKEFKYHYYRPVSGDRAGKKDSRKLYDRIWKEGLKKGVSGYGDIELTRLFFDKLDLDRRSMVLEIGCGIGSFLNSLYVSGYKNTVGVDISKYAVDAGSKKHPHLDLRCMDANSLKFKGGTFDICFSFDLVEHLEDIDMHFKNIWKILKRNGKYTFQTPNKITNVPVSIVRDRNLVGWKVYHPSLQFSWGLKKRLKRAGFREIRFIKIPPLSSYKINQIPKPFRWVFKIIPWKWLPLFLQVNFFVVAGK